MLKKLFILLSALLFTLGIVSVGYGFWTDQLDLNGTADVRIKMTLIDDIKDTVSPPAVQLTEVPASFSLDNSNAASDLTVTNEPLPEDPEVPADNPDNSIINTDADHNTVTDESGTVTETNMGPGMDPVIDTDNNTDSGTTNNAGENTDTNTGTDTMNGDSSFDGAEPENTDDLPGNDLD